MSYQPSVGSLVLEVSVGIVFTRVCSGAWASGRRWLSSLLWGALAGFIAEVFLVHIPAPRYAYALDKFYFTAFDVPVCMGLGWGLVFYASTHAAQRLGLKSAWLSAWVAGVLAVSLDLSLDPAAVLAGLWVWKPFVAGAPASRLLGVPFDNFVAWILITGVYAFWARLLFRWRNRRALVAEERVPGFAASAAPASELWFDVALPLAATLLAACCFLLLRAPGEAVYALTARAGGAALGGDATVFGILFVPGWLTVWRSSLRGTRAAEPSWATLGVALYIQGLALFLVLSVALSGGSSEHRDTVTALVFVLLNAMLSGLTFAWRSLDRLFEREPRPASAGPSFSIQTLRSYSGACVRARVCAPESERELREVLAYARRTGQRVTFRAGGLAFDSQSLNREIVIQLRRFRHIEVDVAAGCVTVGCGAPWGAILRATLPHGLAPPILVTGSSATAGGTLSSHSASRFTPCLGREGRHVDWLKLLTPAGEILTCSRTEAPELFRAVVGGFGYVGAVLELRYRLLRVPPNACIHTIFTRLEGMAAVTGSLVPAEEDAVPVALSIALNGGDRLWGLHARSRYVAARPLARSSFHHPSSLGHLMLQIAALFPICRRIAYALMARVWPADAAREFVDDAFGYTFFEDGNVRLRRVLAALGCRPRVLQQMFLLPRGSGAARTASLEAFLTEARQLLSGRGLDAALFDVLYVPADDEPFLLSSSNGMDGFAVTLTFTALLRDLGPERDAMVALSHRCEHHGGRVSLVKNVCAEAQVIERMYARGLAELAKVRGRVGASALLHNDFAARVLPTLDGTPRARAGGQGVASEQRSSRAASGVLCGDSSVARDPRSASC